MFRIIRSMLFIVFLSIIISCVVSDCPSSIETNDSIPPPSTTVDFPTTPRMYAPRQPSFASVTEYERALSDTAIETTDAPKLANTSSSTSSSVSSSSQAYLKHELSTNLQGPITDENPSWSDFEIMEESEFYDLDENHERDTQLDTEEKDQGIPSASNKWNESWSDLEIIEETEFHLYYSLVRNNSEITEEHLENAIEWVFTQMIDVQSVLLITVLLVGSIFGSKIYLKHGHLLHSIYAVTTHSSTTGMVQMATPLIGWEYLTESGKKWFDGTEIMMINYGEIVRDVSWTPPTWMMHLIAASGSISYLIGSTTVWIKHFTNEFSRKYIEFCEAIANKYGELRKEINQTLCITARCLERIIQLVKAHAKLQLQKKIGRAIIIWIKFIRNSTKTNGQSGLAKLLNSIMFNVPVAVWKPHSAHGIHSRISNLTGQTNWVQITNLRRDLTDENIYTIIQSKGQLGRRIKGVHLHHHPKFENYPSKCEIECSSEDCANSLVYNLRMEEFKGQPMWVDWVRVPRCIRDKVIIMMMVLEMIKKQETLASDEEWDNEIRERQIQRNTMTIRPIPVTITEAHICKFITEWIGVYPFWLKVFRKSTGIDGQWGLSTFRFGGNLAMNLGILIACSLDDCANSLVYNLRMKEFKVQPMWVDWIPYLKFVLGNLHFRDAHNQPRMIVLPGCEATQQFSSQNHRDATSLVGSSTNSTFPTTDANGNSLTTEFGLSTFADHQKIYIQDMPERTEPDSMPQTVECILDEDLVDLKEEDAEDQKVRSTEEKLVAAGIRRADRIGGRRYSRRRFYAWKRRNSQSEIAEELSESVMELSESVMELSESVMELSESVMGLSESELELSESELELSESEQELSESEQEMSEIEQEMSEIEQELSEIEESSQSEEDSLSEMEDWSRDSDDEELGTQCCWIETSKLKEKASGLKKRLISWIKKKTHHE